MPILIDGREYEIEPDPEPFLTGAPFVIERIDRPDVAAERPSLSGVVTSIVGVLVGALLTWLLAGGILVWGDPDASWAPVGGFGGLAVGALCGMATSVASIRVARWFDARWGIAADAERVKKLALLPAWAPPLLFCLTGVLEELFFRGMLLGSVGIWWSSAAFALVHLSRRLDKRVAVFKSVLMFGLGLLAGALTLQFGLASGIGWHVAHNLLAGVALVRIARGLAA